MTKVRLEYESFQNLILSAYAQPTKEIGGVLIGLKQNFEEDSFVVQNALPIQNARRTEGQVITDLNEFRRLGALVPLIGGYHTHVRGRMQENKIKSIRPGRLLIGKSDKKFIKDYYPHGIEIVIALNPATRASRYDLQKNRLRGYFQDYVKKRLFRVELGAYYMIGNREHMAELEIDKETLKSLLLY